MTDGYADAKFREWLEDELDGKPSRAPRHTGLVEPGSRADQLLSFMHSELGPDYLDHNAAQAVLDHASSEYLGNAVQDKTAAAVGITEPDDDFADAKVVTKMTASIHNNGAPYLADVFGGPNTGKTTFVQLLAEMWYRLAPMKYGNEREPVLVSNSDTLTERFPGNSSEVYGSSRLQKLVFANDGKDWNPEIPQETPVLLVLDEASTHLDARTNSREVSVEYLPLIKRAAKVNVDVVHIAHSGMDIYKELRRSNLMTEFIIKRAKTRAEVYTRMDEGKGRDLSYALDNIPLPDAKPVDPDDYAPWAWDGIAPSP